LQKNLIVSFGILGVTFFTVTSILGGLLIENYSPVSQFISEAYAIDTTYGGYLRFFGFIPSGILIALFCFLGVRFFNTSTPLILGFYGMGVFYGLATMLVAIFPCDSGCNKELINPSISQILHNLIGFMTYLVVPALIILVGASIKTANHFEFAKRSKVLGILAYIAVILLLANPESQYVGLNQRFIELLFILWVLGCVIAIKKLHQELKT